MTAMTPTDKHVNKNTDMMTNFINWWNHQEAPQISQSKA
jgi:hypothetical protein